MPLIRFEAEISIEAFEWNKALEKYVEVGHSPSKEDIAQVVQDEIGHTGARVVDILLPRNNLLPR